ncbi:DUF3291 domain-containing protein [uncultured Bradyrhizobium sp.]|uniref:DUF3291 domain-containing protein n=1 Tax=uncultured Bradyrhizobium sp. TaxID=199684 RepID=UPI0035CC41FB
MAQLGFMTFSILRAPYGDALVQEFDDRTPDVFREAEHAPGFIARAKAVDGDEWKTNHQRDWGIWGPFAVPRFYLGGIAQGHSTQAQTLSIWADLASVWHFAYRGQLHRSALQDRSQWFKQQNWPIYCAWWIADHHQPTWGEACTRLEHLHDHGATPYSFTLRRIFAPDGTAVGMEALRFSSIKNQ